MTKGEYNLVLSWAKKVKAVKLLGGKCTKCGNNEVVCLEFHHLSDKEFEPTKLMKGRWSRIEKEIRKCVLLCRNCHAELGCNKNLRASVAKNMLLKAINKFSCEECDYAGVNNASLDFHHENENEKVFCLSSFTARRQVTFDDALIEMKKCTLLCKNCHAKKHSSMFEKYRKLICLRALDHKENQSPLDPAEILAMFNKGIGVCAIAKQIGRHKSTVSTVLKKAKQGLSKTER